MVDTQIIVPVIALVAWSMVMWLWMFATRIPAINKAKMPMDRDAVSGEQMSQLPSSVRWKADNYNHLMEQPTVFYALALSLAVLGEGGGIGLYLAWAYVVLRIIHSLVHSLYNNIMHRFFVYAASNIPLFGLLFIAVGVVV